MQASRLILLICLGLFAFPVLRPAAAKACGMQTQECCEATAHRVRRIGELWDQSAQADQTIPQHCPFKATQTDQCCSGCPLTASLIDSLTAPFVFAEGGGAIFRLRDFSPVRRSDRPPYPPPRA